MTTIKAKLVLFFLPVLLTVALLALPVAAWAGEPFGIAKFENTITNEQGEPATLAGSHPYALTTTIEFATHKTRNEEEKEVFRSGVAPNGDVDEVEVGFPAGVVVNPNATKVKCTEAELDALFECPNASAVGAATNNLAIFVETTRVPVFNMVPPPGVPAELGFEIAGIVVHIYGGVRTGGDYGVSGRASDILQKGALYDTSVTLWGDPTAESHDSERGACVTHPEDCPVAVERTGVSLLTMPTACPGSPLVSTVRADSWEEPDSFVHASAESPAVTGCEALRFAPTLSVHPAEPEAASTEAPTGLEVNLKVSQEESLAGPATGLATSDLKEARVTLPAGVTVSPSAANGLGACPLLRGREPAKEEKESKREPVGINLESKQPANCPPESKLGTVEVVTPLLESPLKGSVYLAQQGDLPGAGSNPFGSLFALYLVAEGSGAIVKLPGEVKLDQATGQVSARFGEDPTTGFDLPQLPFSELKMRFFGGPRAPLVTPSSCGSYTTTSQLTPWDGNPAVESSSPFTVGSGCGAFGFNPSFTAGTANNQAGGYSSFGVTLSRNDGDQRLAGVSVTTPPGLLGTLKNVVQCPEPQASRGECSQASEIGETTTAVGPGSDPYWVTGGKVYLTGPYNNGPFGLSIVVPTTAGPFTLTGNGGPGREIVRASIRVNPATSQITVVSDPLPTMLEGVPLDIRTVNVNINRPDFMFNPTNCSPSSVGGTLTSTQGDAAGVSSPFEAANCAALPFKPSFSASTQSQASKADGASLVVTVTSGAGQANIGKVDLQLPKQLPSRLTTLQKACTEAQFDANPAGCPEGSEIGMATAHTPVLNAPLTGPAYLVSHGGAAFPDVEFVLQGEGVEIVLDGQTQIKNGITYSHFDTVPDAPISSFETVLPEGPHSVLGTNLPASAHYSLCGQSLVIPTTITGQNGALVTQTTGIAVTGCKPEIRVVKHSVKGKTATLTVSVPAAGKLVATGKRLSKASKSTSSATGATLTVKLTLSKAEAAFLKKHMGRQLEAKIHLSFKPSKGKALSTTLSVVFKK